MVYDCNGTEYTTTASRSIENEENGESKSWNISRVYGSDFTVGDLVKVLEIVDVFKRKYPNDETFTNFEECVREEICNIFGGELYED